MAPVGLTQIMLRAVGEDQTQCSDGGRTQSPGQLWVVMPGSMAGVRLGCRSLPEELILHQNSCNFRLTGLLRPGIGLAARMQVCCWAGAARHCAVYLIDMQSHFALPATGSQGDNLLITMPLHKPSSDLSGLLHKPTQNKHADPRTTWCSSDVPRSTCAQMSCQLLPGRCASFQP